MNVGSPNRAAGLVAAEEVGYAYSSVDPRKGKSGSSEGALLLSNFSITNNIRIDLQKSGKRRSCKAGRTVPKGQALDECGRKS